MLLGPADVAALALQRRRLLSDRQLAAMGLDPAAAGLTPDWLPKEAAVALPAGSDPGWAISVVESRHYQTNVLLRDNDADAMAHGLEVRVPFLDQRLLDWMHRLPGAVRFPARRPPKALLRAAVGDLVDPPILARPKTGFTLPVGEWMAGPLRAVCEDRIAAVRDCGLLAPAGPAAVWQAFTVRPAGPAWSRALTLVALGDYLRRHAA
jgi:asparagine synthase (glutamine-hydrolysing)